VASARGEDLPVWGVGQVPAIHSAGDRRTIEGLQLTIEWEPAAVTLRVEPNGGHVQTMRAANV
jgi:hypothetical protein